MRRLWIPLAILAAAAAALVPLRWRTPAGAPADSISSPETGTPSASYIGSEACAGCHSAEAASWKGSQHAGAMAKASDRTVLGRFEQTTFTYAGITSTFHKRDGRFYVRTDGGDGKLTDFEVGYTFGLYPLQQYLIPMPGGRLQALSIAWDARPKAAGGQRWFHLYPNQPMPHTDPLHWTRHNQNWNYMCADCHSTNLRANYDLQSDCYATTWSEINVSCEA